jgi:hypothetical protein
MKKKVIKKWYLINTITIIEIIKIINCLMKKNKEIIILSLEILHIKINLIIHY